MIHELLSSDLGWRLGWMLLHSVWQIVLVGVLVALVMPLLSRRSANLRYCIACCGMAFLYVPLAITFFLVPLRPSAEQSIASDAASTLPNRIVAANVTAPETDVATMTYEPTEFIASPVAATEARVPEPVDDDTRAAGLIPVVSPWLPWVVGLWFAALIGYTSWQVVVDEGPWFPKVLFFGLFSGLSLLLLSVLLDRLRDAKDDRYRGVEK